VPPVGEPPATSGPTPASALEGLYGPAAITADGDDVLLTATPMGIDGARHERAYGDTFLALGRPPGGMAIAFDGDLLYLGPFALPRAS